MAGWRMAFAVAVAVAAGAGCGSKPTSSAPPPPAPREWLQDAPTAHEAVLVCLAERRQTKGMFKDPDDRAMQVSLLIDGKPPADDLMQRLKARNLPCLGYTAAKGRSADFELETVAGGGTSALTIRVSDGSAGHPPPGVLLPDPGGEVYSATEVKPGRWRVVEQRR